MNDGENVDENEDDDVLCSLLSRQSYDVGCKTFSGAADVASVKEQIDDDTEAQNTCEQMISKSKTTHTNVKQHRCDVCYKAFSHISNGHVWPLFSLYIRIVTTHTWRLISWTGNRI